MKRFKYQKKEILEELYSRRYASAGKIAKIFGVNRNTVLYWLKRHGIPRRKCTEYVRITKHPFSGDVIEKAYLIGLRYGDIYARMHGKQIDVATTSTHPAMTELFKKTFAKYTVVSISPHKNHRYFEWRAGCYLHRSFDFLLQRGSSIPTWILQNRQYFLHFLSGFFDSEGSIGIRCAPHGCIRYGLTIPNVNIAALREIKNQLLRMGLCPKLYPHYQSDKCWQLVVNKKGDVFKLLSWLKIRHSEKIRRRRLVFQLKGTVKRWAEAKPKVLALRHEIKEEVRRHIQKAKLMYELKFT